MHSFATSICSENNQQLSGIYFYQYTLNITSSQFEKKVQYYKNNGLSKYEFNFVLKS